MERRDPSFVDYTNCMAKCTSVPPSPWGSLSSKLASTNIQHLRSNQDGECQCEAGSYWCSSDDFLRYTFNCSGSAESRNLYASIHGSDTPSQADCQSLSTICDGVVGAHGAVIAQKDCDDSCYDYCWGTQAAGDCDDDDDEQILCVGQCMTYCTTERCGAQAPAWSECQLVCNAKFMNVTKPEFIDYSDCMAQCAPLPSSPHGNAFIV